MNNNVRTQRTKRKFYVYDIGQKVLAGNATGTYPVTIETDAAFEVVNLTWYSTSTLVFQIKESDRTWFFHPLDTRLVCGDGKQPYILPVPRVIQKNVTMEITVTDTSGSSNTFNIALLGNKLYQFVTG